MKEALRALNRLIELKVIENYGVGGAIGAAFYIDAMQTEDVDAFVVLPASGSLLASLSPIYEALEDLGGVVEREYVRFGDWPLQVLTDANPLIAEAIAEAMPVDYGDVPTRVFRPEYLCAIALQTGRAKDYLRVRTFLEQGAVDAAELEMLVGRFGLQEAFGKLSIL
jgi:hypothetical protein